MLLNRTNRVNQRLSFMRSMVVVKGVGAVTDFNPTIPEMISNNLRNRGNTKSSTNEKLLNKNSSNAIHKTFNNNVSPSSLTRVSNANTDGTRQRPFTARYQTNSRI